MKSRSAAATLSFTDTEWRRVAVQPHGTIKGFFVTIRDKLKAISRKFCEQVKKDVKSAEPLFERL